MPRKSYKSRSHLVLPDVQARPGVSLEHLSWIGQYIVDKKPEVVICIGDFADMESLSSYDKGKKSFEGRRYKADIEVAHKGMELLLGPLKAFNKKKAKAKQYNPRLVMTLGNHDSERIRRAVEDDPKLDGVISVDDLKYKEFGWEVHPFLKPVMIDGVAYAHYFTSGVMGRPVSSARALVKTKHCSAVMGHVQDTDVYMKDTRADGKQITGLFCGTAYTHDEVYLGEQGNFQRRQIVVLNEVNDGEFDLLFVSLAFLKRKYAQ